MVMAAGLLVLLGLGLFGGGLATGLAALHWACVAVCALAVVLLGVARVRAGGGCTAAGGEGAAAAGGSERTAQARPPLPGAGAGRAPGTADPAEEDAGVPDLLLLVGARDEVLVVDEHPRFHLAGCPALAGRTAVPLPLAEARAGGFTPCARCRPVRCLADAERSRRAARSG